jgi:hypothetical protein
MLIRGAPRILTLLTLLGLSGCAWVSTSVHSDAVRKLIEKEAEKIQAAQGQANKLGAETRSRNKAVREALDNLSRAREMLQTQESIHALTFSSNQNLASKESIDAHAVTYLIGAIYLEEQAGLDRRVRDQFEEDFTALGELAARLDMSWNSLNELQKQIAEYADKSAVATVDPGLLAAVIEEIPGSPEGIERVLENSRRLNKALETAIGSGYIKGDTLEQLRSVTRDLIDLFERVQ